MPLSPRWRSASSRICRRALSFVPLDASVGESPGSGADHDLFSYEVRRGGRVVVQLRGLDAGNGQVIVEADVFPVSGDDPGLRRPFTFASRTHAMDFVDETLTALEYLACTVA